MPKKITLAKTPISVPATGQGSVDLREQTFNQGHTGPIGAVSTPREQVGQIRSIMYDIDLKQFRPNGPFSPSGRTPEEFFERFLVRWIENHPVLSKAEVRFTGNGFHALLYLAKPILLRTPDMLRRWSGIVGVVQAALPIDLRQPGINALTRPVGSVNSKNGKIVALLRRGEPVSQQEILALYETLSRRPFPTLLQIWLGGEKVEPCPICQAEYSYLETKDAKKGRCYGACRKLVTVNALADSVLIKQKQSK